MSKKLGKILVGILIAACGVCIGGQACGLLPGGLSMDGWWTVFLIVPGVLFLACVGLNAFGALLTGLGVYDDIAKLAGAGTLVPITGFANSVAAPALEFKTEGFITGTAAKMFVIAGPVIVYGISASVVYGLALVLFG